MSLLALFTTRQTRVILITGALLNSVLVAMMRVQPPAYEFNDAHLYLADHLQPRASLRQFLELLGARPGRAALIAIADPAPSLRVETKRTDGDPRQDDPPPYDSFTDAWIATAYKSLTTEQQARFDPMITGFNPADRYAADHIRRVLETFPGVFTGIAIDTIPPEYVSPAAPSTGLRDPDPAFNRLLDFAAAVGLIVLVGNTGFGGEGDATADFGQLKTLLKCHPNTIIIWAHSRASHASDVERILADAELRNVYFDVSSRQAGAPVSLITRFPDRFLFGTDEIAQSGESDSFRASKLSDPPWLSFSPVVSTKVRKLNYERIFDLARHRVRAWEHAHLQYRW